MPGELIGFVVVGGRLGLGGLLSQFLSLFGSFLGCLLCLFSGLLLFCTGLRCLFSLGGLIFDFLLRLFQLRDFFL